MHDGEREVASPDRPDRLPAQVREFVQRYSPDPAALCEQLARLAFRGERFRHGSKLCSKGDVADRIWILLEGAVRIEEEGQLVGFRRAGEIVGEMSFYRVGERRRGADMFADGEVVAFRVDRLGELTPEGRALWHETMARVLTAKLDEAQTQRIHLRSSNYETEDLLRRFVDPEGFGAVTAAIAAGGAGAVDPERCDAILWFSDIAGFSACSMSRSPSEIAKIIRQLMDIQAEAIRKAEGEVDKFMGDGLMGFWRVPDDDRRNRRIPRAVAAAIEVSERIREFAAANDLPIDIRVGLHCGPAVIGDFGGGDRIAFTVIGETVNAASRYEQARQCAEGRALGRVRLSAAVHDLLNDERLKGRFESERRSISDKHGVIYPVHTLIDGESC